MIKVLDLSMMDKWRNSSNQLRLLPMEEGLKSLSTRIFIKSLIILMWLSFFRKDGIDVFANFFIYQYLQY
jgi:hypothetical protein